MPSWSQSIRHRFEGAFVIKIKLKSFSEYSICMEWNAYRSVVQSVIGYTKYTQRERVMFQTGISSPESCTKGGIVLISKLKLQMIQCHLY